MIFSCLARPGGRILLVDDDADAALFATHVLSTVARFSVTHTADPAVALRLATQGGCDLLLTEAYLPGLTGGELTAAVRRLVPGLPVIVLTSRLLGAGEARTLRKLADAYLEKPVPAERLIATATRLLAAG